MTKQATERYAGGGWMVAGGAAMLIGAGASGSYISSVVEAAGNVDRALLITVALSVLLAGLGSVGSIASHGLVGQAREVTDGIAKTVAGTGWSIGLIGILTRYGGDDGEMPEWLFQGVMVVFVLAPTVLFFVGLGRLVSRRMQKVSTKRVLRIITAIALFFAGPAVAVLAAINFRGTAPGVVEAIAAVTALLGGALMATEDFLVDSAVEDGLSPTRPWRGYMRAISHALTIVGGAYVVAAVLLRS